MDLFSLALWTPSELATATTAWTSIASTNTKGAFSTIASAKSVFPNAWSEKNWVKLRSLSQVYRGAQATLQVISAEEVLATATDSEVKAMATQAIFNNTLNLKALDREMNPYKYDLSRPANIIYLVVFLLIFLYNDFMVIKSRYHWYNVTYFCGYGLEFCGFLGRVLAFNDVRNENYYILQFCTLTIAPAFIMAGIYFLFAQLVVIHGRQYSVLKPLWYSYFFITTDVVSLVIQAGGGAYASIANKRMKDTTPGTNTIIAGIALQTFAMSIFLCFWFEFLNRIYFKNRDLIEGGSPYKKRSIANFFKLLFNVKSCREYKTTQLENFYNQNFQLIRFSKLFPYMPLAITTTVVVVYIRCIYRVVELGQGWRGYLIEHEVYLMVLDALMIAAAGIISVPFHPVWVFGKQNVVKLQTIRKKHDVLQPPYEDLAPTLENQDEKDDEDAEVSDHQQKSLGN